MIFSLLCVVAGCLHPIHLSVTEITFSEKDKALQIASRIFIDDLELTLQREFKDEELNLLTPENGKTTDEMVSAYMLKHLKVKVDSKAQVLKYLGHEIEDVAIVCYIEIPNIKKFKNIEVMNNVIMETHSDQSNLVHVTHREKVKSARLVKEKIVETFVF